MPDSPPALTPVLGRRERRKLEVRNRIYNAARELFAKQGFDATPVDEIAELADVAPATFFNHFHSKHALLRLMTAEVVEHLHAMTLDNLDRPGAPLDRLDRFVRRAAEDISSNRRGARETLLEFLRLDGTPDGPHPFLSRLVEPFVALIEEGQKRGEIRCDRPAVFLTQMLIGMLNAAITSWLTDADYPIEDGLVAALEFALETLRPRPEGGTD